MIFNGKEYDTMYDMDTETRAELIASLGNHPLTECIQHLLDNDYKIKKGTFLECFVDGMADDRYTNIGEFNIGSDGMTSLDVDIEAFWKSDQAHKSKRLQTCRYGIPDSMAPGYGIGVNKKGKLQSCSSWFEIIATCKLTKVGWIIKYSKDMPSDTADILDSILEANGYCTGIRK